VNSAKKYQLQSGKVSTDNAKKAEFLRKQGFRDRSISEWIGNLKSTVYILEKKKK